MKRLFVILLLTIATTAYGNDLRISGKGIEFFLNAEMGAFYVENPAPTTPALKTLLFSDNPPTSYITVIINGKPYRMNDHALTVIQPFAEGTDNVTGVFGVSGVEIKVVFQATNSATSQNDTILCYLAFNNTTTNNITVGARFLYDTFFDERWGKPVIYTSSGEQIKTERLMYPENFPNFLYSGTYDIDAGFTEGIFVYPYVNDLKPTSIIVGNWKKLDENELGYPIDARSDFRYNNYANKDAAVAIFFENIPMKGGEEIRFGTVLSRSAFQFSQYVAGRYVANMIELVGTTEPVVTNVTVVPAPTNVEPEVVQVTQTQVVQQTVEPVVTNQTVAVHNPQTNVVTLFVTNQMTPRAISNINELEIMRLQLETLDKLVALIEKMDGRLTETAQTITEMRTTTNVVTNTAAIETLKTQYETALASQQREYETRLDTQNREYTTQITTLQNELERNSASSLRNASLEQLDATINELDQKIKLIEQLERMNLDFNTMPESELRRLNEQIEQMERRVLRTQGR